jgi:hypothetical protein
MAHGVFSGDVVCLLTPAARRAAPHEEARVVTIGRQVVALSQRDAVFGLDHALTPGERIER